MKPSFVLRSPSFSEDKKKRKHPITMVAATSLALTLLVDMEVAVAMEIAVTGLEYENALPPLDSI